MLENTQYNVLLYNFLNIYFRDIFYFREYVVLVFNWNTAASVILPVLALDVAPRF